MELALAVPDGTAQPDIQAQMVAASADSGGDVAGAAPPAADDEGWITAGSLRAQRAARRGGEVARAGVATAATADAPSQAEILFATDISTGLPAAGGEPSSSLDPAAAAAAAAELLDMGFESDRVQVTACWMRKKIALLHCTFQSLECAPT
jgi:hypothetical protein